MFTGSGHVPYGTHDRLTEGVGGMNNASTGHDHTDYYELVTGQLEKAAEVYELWQKTYPRDVLPPGNLGIIYGALGNWQGALEEARAAGRKGGVTVSRDRSHMSEIGR